MTHSITFNGLNDFMSYSDQDFNKIYQRYLSWLLFAGELFEGRNGTTKSALINVTVDLSINFPLIQCRRLPIKSLISEFLFELGLSTNIKDMGTAAKFWAPFADEDGWLGCSAYNSYWRQYPPTSDTYELPNTSFKHEGPIDQLNDVINQLRTFPNTRRAVLGTWNPTVEWSDLPNACPPCHIGVIFSPSNSTGRLNAMVPARSNDGVLGFPLDIVRYSLLLTVVSQLTGFKPGFLSMPSINSHIYSDHWELAHQMAFDETIFQPVQLELVPKSNLAEYTSKDFSFKNYQPNYLPTPKLSV